MSGVFCKGCGGVFSDQKHLRGCGCDDALKADLAKREKDDERRAALAKAEAERDALKQDIEDRDRAIESLRLKVDTAHGHIDALKARAERLAALCDALLWEGSRPACMATQQRAIKAARAAVDAHRDLEATP